MVLIDNGTLRDGHLKTYPSTICNTSKRVCVAVLYAESQFRRRGSLLVEMVVCTVLLSVVAALLVPGIHAVHEQRKAARFDAMAIIELNNLAAGIRRGVNTVELSDWFQQRYPQTTFSAVPVAGDAAGMAAVRLVLTVPSTDARPDVVRTLVVWTEQQEAAE